MVDIFGNTKYNIIKFGITKQEMIFMTDYQPLYTTLFNAITDALRQMDAQNYGVARDLLIRAQQKTEAYYMDSDT